MENITTSSENIPKAANDVNENVCKKPKKDIVIGIDLGTTNSCVALFQNGNYGVISNSFGERTTPSIVTFTENQNLIGKAAKDFMVSNPKNTIHDAKRLIGRKYHEACIKDDIENWQFKVVDQSNKPMIEIPSKGIVVDPEFISSLILKYLKEVAEDYVGQSIVKAVISVPAYFNDIQKQATIRAGILAGFEKPLIINEPTAAAIAFGFKKEKFNNVKTDDVCNMLVFDLGGGTFDVSILTYQSNDYLVRSIKGDNHLGGEDFSQNLVNYCLDELQKRSIDIKDDASALNRLHEECEKTKCMLSYCESREISFQSKSQSTLINVTRDNFEKLCETYFSKIMELVIKCVDESKIEKNDIHQIVLVGGSSRIPKIKTILENYFAKPVTKTVNVDECVAIGAAIKGAMVFSNNNPDVCEISLVDIIPLSIGVRLKGVIMSPIIKRNSTLPASWKIKS